MKKTSKVARFVSSFLLIAMLLSCCGMIALADAQDSYFHFYIGNGNQWTDVRLKETTTSAYMFYNSGRIEYVAAVYGQEVDGNTTGRFDCSHGRIYRFSSVHEKRFMYNFVLEDGYKYARIKLLSYQWETIAGFWSPDSVPGDGILPASDYISGNI